MADARNPSPSVSHNMPYCAPQMRVAFSSMALNTGSKSPGELEMTCSTSEVAVCCSSASASSRLSCARPPALRARALVLGAEAADFFFPFATTPTGRRGVDRRGRDGACAARVLRRLLIGARPSTPRGRDHQAPKRHKIDAGPTGGMTNSRHRMGITSGSAKVKVMAILTEFPANECEQSHMTMPSPAACHRAASRACPH